MGKNELFLFIFIVAFAAALSICAYFLNGNEKYKKILSIIFKAAAITTFSFYIIRNTLSDHFVWQINGGVYAGSRYDNHDYLQSFLRWSFLVSVCIMPVAAFYKNNTVNRLAFYVSVVNVILTIIFYADYMKYFQRGYIDPNNVRGIVTKPWFRNFEFDVEIASMAISTLILGFTANKKLLFSKRRDVVNFVCFLPAIFLVAIPVYLPQSLFGFTSLFMNLFSPQHFAWLGLTVILFFVIYFGFRNQSKTIKKIIVLYASLFVFQHYNSMYLMSLSAQRLPFQLCNVGSYFMLVLFIFQNKKWCQKFFDFVFIINVFGTIVATIGFDLEEGMLSFWNIHYYLEHTWIFSIPLLMLAFGIFKLPEHHAIKHAVVGFTIYFVICLTAGLLFNAYKYDPASRFWNRCDYFYLFNEDIVSFLKFLPFIVKHPAQLNGFYFYPLYMVVAYVAFLSGSIAWYFLDKKFYSVAKDHIELHRMNKTFKEKKGEELC